MPIYVYECKACLKEFKVSHGMNEELEACKFCSSADIARKPMFFSNLSREGIQREKKVGETTKEFIENARDDLRAQKKELDKKR